MNKETADLVDLQELFEMAGPSIFLDGFDVSGFISFTKNEDGVFLELVIVASGVLQVRVLVQIR